MIKYVLALLPLVGRALAPQQKPATKPESTTAVFNKSVAPLVRSYCLPCHNKNAASAGLQVESFLTPDSLEKAPAHWRHLVHLMRTDYMPPASAPKPDPKELKKVTDWISGVLEQQEREAKPKAGRVTARRLNRTEYNNTVRDLLGVDSRPADDFPQDDSGYGFDTIGDVLSVSPPLLEKYLTAAERVARAALFGPERMSPRLIELRPARSEPPGPSPLPVNYDKTGLHLPQAVHTLYRFPTDGQYELHGVLTGMRPVNADPIQVAVWIDGTKATETRYEPQGIPSFPGGPMELYGQRVIFPRISVPAGEHWVAIAIERLYEGFPASFGGPNPSKKPEPPAAPRTFRLPEPPPSATPEEKAEFEKRRKGFEEFIKKQQAQLPNSTRVGSLEIGGPYGQRLGASAKSRALLYTCGHLDDKHKASCAPKVIRDFMARAFRRPVTTAETAPYLKLYTETRKQGDSFDEGLCAAIQAVLVSPHFLFRIEKDALGSTRKLTDHELATRLAYFLWSTTPDTELRRCADSGTLRRPEVLEAQVTRMLRDPKARALVENFGGQWLELRKLEAARPDREKFDRFDEYLRISMKRETEIFFQEIVQSDRPILDFLSARYTFLNQKLAEFYGIPGVQGVAFRRVDLSGTQRGGILTQASVLTVTSYPNRTSPVVRGKWILDNLLGTPPPPPPPGVPGLEETKVAAGASLRQQLEEHRKKPLCASCHSRLDPLGFGLENFDAVGSWRTVDGKTPIEASGELPGGKHFQGPQELSAILLADKDAFTRCLTTKLLTYALGRGLERYDQPTVQQIAAQTGKANYRFSRLVMGIVTSLPFQQREGKS